MSESEKPSLEDPSTEAPPKETEETPKDTTLEKNLAILNRILDMVRGKVDLRHRLDAILAPKNPLTSSNLNANQVEYVRTCYWLAETWPDLYGFLKSDADKLMAAMMSQKGWAVEQSIKMVGAIEQSQAFKAMVGSASEKKSHNPLKRFSKATDRE